MFYDALRGKVVVSGAGVLALLFSGVALGQYATTVQSATGATADWPNATVVAGVPFKLLSGGARTNSTGYGNLLTQTSPGAPGQNAWVAAGKDHSVVDATTATVFGIALNDPNDDWDVGIFTTTSPVAAHPVATATLPAGYALTGGGCTANWQASPTPVGSLLTASFPSSPTTWECRSKDHSVPDPVALTAYVVGIRPKKAGLALPTVQITTATSAVASHPSAIAPAVPGAVVTGGGALALPSDPAGAGQLLISTVPTTAAGSAVPTGWFAASKDHSVPSPGTIQAFAVNLTFPPPPAAAPPPPPAPVASGKLAPPPMLPISLPPSLLLSPISAGTGISDITGPIAEVTLNGYAQVSQAAAGLSMRLHARAFVFLSPSSGRRVAFVSADLAYSNSSIKQGVLRALSQHYGPLFNDTNVMISVTHTHAGPGGTSHHPLYNLSSFGFVRQNYDAIVAGITEAIIQANDRVTPASLSYAEGPILGTAAVNRSEVAFRLNPEVTGRYPNLPGAPPPPTGPLADPPIDPTMKVLRIDVGTRPIGAISWFAVHNTSMTQDNHLVSSDHKGWAAYQFEKSQGSIVPYVHPGDFVAAFPNGAEGDVSPNIINAGRTGPGPDPTSAPAPNPFAGTDDHGFLSMQNIGDKEFHTAAQLWSRPSSGVAGDVDFRHMFVAMPGLAVNTPNTNGLGSRVLCAGAMGASFAAGAEDGPSGMPIFTEGMTIPPVTTALVAGASGVITALGAPFIPLSLGTISSGSLFALPAIGAAANDACQLPKPILIPTSTLGWTPNILPFQLLRIGTMALVGVPGEMTTEAGRRLHDRVARALAPIGVTKVVITGLANEYSGYITTPEEYNSQQYEGASTLFGRLTFDAYLQIFGQLADAMAAGQPVPAGPAPPDLSPIQIELQTGPIADASMPGPTIFDPPLTIGTVMQQPPSVASRGSVIVARFVAGHPKNDLRRNSTYAVVERDAGGGNWVPVAWDSMPEMAVTWTRDSMLIGTSHVDVKWAIPGDAVPGSYRIRHYGAWKELISQSISPYEGTTQIFTVN